MLADYSLPIQQVYADCVDTLCRISPTTSRFRPEQKRIASVVHKKLGEMGALNSENIAIIAKLAKQADPNDRTWPCSKQCWIRSIRMTANCGRSAKAAFDNGDITQGLTDSLNQTVA